MEAIQKWPILTNITEVSSFLGFTNYYPKFIKKYEQVAKPLYQLISGENVARKCNSVKLDPECQDAFDKHKELCTSTPVLTYVDFKKLLRLHIDTSIFGLGAVLYQEQDGIEKVVSYTSQSFSKSE